MADKEEEAISSSLFEGRPVMSEKRLTVFHLILIPASFRVWVEYVRGNRKLTDGRLMDVARPSSSDIRNSGSCKLS